VSCAAGISLQPLTFWPDHKGEKSPEPWLSVLARKGARAAIANGKAGVASRQAAEMALSHYLDDFNLDKEQSGGPDRA